MVNIYPKTIKQSVKSAKFEKNKNKMGYKTKIFS